MQSTAITSELQAGKGALTPKVVARGSTLIYHLEDQMEECCPRQSALKPQRAASSGSPICVWALAFDSKKKKSSWD